MWPRKKKIIKEIDLITRQATLKAIQNQLLPKCPIPSCICYTCSCRGTCHAEKEVHGSGACSMEGGPRILSCSWNKHLKGEFDDAKKKDTIGRESGDSPTNIGDFWGFGEIPTVQG